MLRDGDFGRRPSSSGSCTLGLGRVGPTDGRAWSGLCRATPLSDSATASGEHVTSPVSVVCCVGELLVRSKWRAGGPPPRVLPCLYGVFVLSEHYDETYMIVVTTTPALRGDSALLVTR